MDLKSLFWSTVVILTIIAVLIAWFVGVPVFAMWIFRLPITPLNILFVSAAANLIHFAFGRIFR